MVKNKSEILITVLTTSSVRNRTPNLPSVFIDGFDLKKKTLLQTASQLQSTTGSSDSSR